MACYNVWYPSGDPVLSRHSQRLRTPLPLLVLLPALVSLAGCVGSHALARRDAVGVPGVVWFAPAVAADRGMLALWSAAVGPPVVRNIPAQVSEGVDTLRVVSWNTALGAGNVGRLLEDLRGKDANGHLVLLLQEVYRDGPEVPASRTPDLRFAGRLGAGIPTRHEIEVVAATYGLNLYYVPSMRNGAPLDSSEDRGNAILSTLPLTELCAIELPFERQRRVAVAATVSGRSTAGQPWRVRVVSSHLDNMVGASRGWILGAEHARIRQARALIEYLRDEEIVVLGGDFNTWFGFAERTYGEIHRAFPDSSVEDRRPTFMGLLRLDHIFFRLPDGWVGRFQRGADRYGSDHYPLVATISIGRSGAGSGQRTTP